MAVFDMVQDFSFKKRTPMHTDVHRCIQVDYPYVLMLSVSVFF